MRFAVFISGYGSNLQAIIDAVQAGQIKAELALVVSNKKSAFGLQRAEKAGIKIAVFDPKDYTNTQSVDRDMAGYLRTERIDFIVLAGYMRLLTEFFVKSFPNKIITVHPSLLPSFRGMQGIKDAYTFGAKVTGATVHFVNEKMDNGPIILQDSVKIADNDTVETIAEKVHKIEHRILLKAIELFAEERLRVKGRKVYIIEKPPNPVPPIAHHSPDPSTEEKGDNVLL